MKAIALITLLLAGCGGSSDMPPASAQGSVSVAGCVIPAAANSCVATVQWSATAAGAPRVTLGSSTLSSALSGNLSTSVAAGAFTVSLLDGATVLDQETLVASCASASAWDGASCREFAERSVDRADTPFVESGQPVTLEVVAFKPLNVGPFPALIFHHGSTGNGDDPRLFTQTYTNETLAKFFVDRGWMVLFPQRRGRGASGGLYDEGFEADRSRYSCRRDPALAGLERALQDAGAVLAHVRSRPDVISSQLLVGGVSRGGILAIAHAARSAGSYRAAVNFVGGWLGEGCVDAVFVNRSTFAAAGAAAGATTWFYGESDSFYSIAHSRANHDAFVGAGGIGEFRVYARAPQLNGHFIINDPALWSADLTGFLNGLP